MSVTKPRPLLCANVPRYNKRLYESKLALHARMSRSTVCNTTVSTNKTREISTPVACNAACVQGTRFCKCEREICVRARHQA